MIKVKALRSMAKERGLKTSVTAIAGADRLAETAIDLACIVARGRKDPKLESKHFDPLIIEIKMPAKKRKKR